MRPLIFALATTTAPASALAHAGLLHEEAGGGWLSTDPWVLAGLAATAAAYGLGYAGLRGRSGRTIASAGAGVAFGAAMVIAWIVLAEPMDRLTAQLFSAHMVQHLVLMLIVAPLLVWGRLGTVFLWALPGVARRSAVVWWARRGASRFGPLFAHPVAIWAWFCGIFVFWHIPGPYRWALENQAVHILEHLLFIAASYGFWAIVIAPLGRRVLGYGSSILFVATAAIVSGLPGALMILASRPLYDGHAAGAAAWGLTTVQDQQLGGLIMWIPAGFAYLIAVSVLLLQWLRDCERRSALRPHKIGSIAGAIAVFLLVGCDETGVGTRFDDIGSADRGALLIRDVGCGSCHKIPGIEGAEGLVGPPLDHMGKRIFIAGLLRNTPANMMTWLRDPQEVVPGNAMPDMGLSEEQARDITAYLYTLE